MIGRRFPLDGLGLLAGVVWVIGAGGVATAQERTAATVAPAAPVASPHWVTPENLPPHLRDRVRLVLAHPTLETRGPTEVFRGDPELYHWFLDHPDRAVPLWRKLGAKCMDIRDRGNGCFGCSDGQGSDIRWETAYRGQYLRIWYAEGEARPGPLFSAVVVRAVVVLRYRQNTDALGHTVLQHQADLFLHTDSKAVALATKLLGASAPQLARQCVGQMELFFSFPVAYLDRHPERAEALLLGGLPAGSPAAKELRRFLPKT